MKDPMYGVHPLQAMMDGFSAVWQQKRSKTQMTLGQLITWLEARDGEAFVTGLGSLHSYRGYYSDLSFEPNTTPRTVGDLLAECRKAMGHISEGVHGVDFLMGETTPLWVASYGCCGPRLMGMTDVAPFQPITAEESPDA